MQKTMTTGDKLRKWFRIFYRQRYLHLFMIPALACLIVFKYAPIFGLQIAFKEYSFRKGIFGSPWVGLKQFEKLFRDITLWPAVSNTLLISLLKLAIGFPLPILFALLLNEMNFNPLKRTIQTISYFPHFIAYSVVALMLTNILSSNGILNTVLVTIGVLKEPYLFLGDASAFKWIASITDVWKTTGWNSIIYFAALTSISPELYEAATVDGANRYHKMWHITLPGIRSTIVVLLIMNVGRMMSIGFDRPFIIGNTVVQDACDVISTFVYRAGIKNNQFARATAIGLFQSVVGLVLITAANFTSRLFDEQGIW